MAAAPGMVAVAQDMPSVHFRLRAVLRKFPTMSALVAQEAPRSLMALMAALLLLNFRPVAEALN
jgi:hypothetical protein